MNIVKTLAAYLLVGLSAGNSHAVEAQAIKAIAEAGFDWTSFTAKTYAAPGSNATAPVINWIYQDSYVDSDGQTNHSNGWDTELDIAGKAANSWSKINASTLQSYANDINLSPESKVWASGYRVAGFTVTGSGTVVFSAKYALKANLNPGDSLPSYADASVMFTASDTANNLAFSEKDSIDINSSNANTPTISKADTLALTLSVQDGQQFKFSADVHAKAALSKIPAGSSTISSEEAIVLGSWCANASGCDALFRVNLASGKRVLLSAYTKADEDRLYDAPATQLALDRGGKTWEKLAMATSGELYVYSAERFDLKTNSSHQGIYRIDPSSGSRQLVSNLDGSNISASDSMVITPSNQVLLARSGQLFSIDPVTGQLQVLSDATQSSQGPVFSAVLGVDISGEILGMDAGGLVKVDANTGGRSYFANYKLAPGSTLAMIASDDSIFSVINGGQLYKFNNTGASNLVSNLLDAGQGQLINNAKALDEDSAGHIILLDSGDNQGLGQLVSIDPNTGSRTLVSNFHDQNQGPVIYDARAIAVGILPNFIGNDNGNGVAVSSKPVLSQVESTDSVQIGQTFSYIVTFSNYDTSVANKVILTNNLPKKARLVSVVASQGKKCKGKTQVVCNFGSLVPGARVIAKLTVIKTKPGQLKNTAIVSYNMKKAASKKMKTYRFVSAEVTGVK